MCGSSGSTALSEESISNGSFDAATRCGTVEYEVGGAYCVRKEGPVQNVHLYGVEYVPPTRMVRQIIIITMGASRVMDGSRH